MAEAISINPFYEMIEAMSLDQETEGQMQIADGNATIMDSKIEATIYNYQTETGGPIQSVVSQMNTIIDQLSNNPTPNEQGYLTSELSGLNAQFGEAQTNEQAYTNAADSMVQQTQNQTGQDGTNLQQMTQVVQAVMSVLQENSSLLAATY